jgi:NADPH:quinone reductase
LERGSHEAIARIIDPVGGIVTNLLPVADFAKSGKDFKYPDGVTSITTLVGQASSKHKDFAFVIFRYLSLQLKLGKFKTQPYEVVPGGLEGVEKGRANLKSGKVSGVKYVYRVPDTPGAGQDVYKA